MNSRDKAIRYINSRHDAIDATDVVAIRGLLASYDLLKGSFAANAKETIALRKRFEALWQVKTDLENDVARLKKEDAQVLNDAIANIDRKAAEIARLEKIEVAAKAIADHAEEIEFDDAMGFAASLDYLSDLNSALDRDDSPACSTCRHYKMPCTQNQHSPDCTGYVAESV